MQLYDLTTLTSVKTWLTDVTTSDDALLSQLITDTSAAIYNSLGRGSLLPLAYNESYDGHGGKRLFLKNWPVISVNSLAINGAPIPVSPPLVANGAYTAGYVLSTVDDAMPAGDMQQISLRGYVFCRGMENIVLNYTAGYQVTKERQSVPASGPFTITAAQPWGMWATDQGVTYAATGVALVAVTGIPTVGQYSVSGGIYTFAAADAGAAVLITYGFIPTQLSRSCAIAVGEIYRYRDRIGTNSKSLGGQETVSFNPDVTTKLIDNMEGLRAYRRVVPI